MVKEKGFFYTPWDLVSAIKKITFRFKKKKNNVKSKEQWKNLLIHAFIFLKFMPLIFK